jgi:hypothetical protein
MSETVSIELQHVPKTETLLLGYSIGSADLPHGRKLQLIAAGAIVRFSIEGIDGYVDLNLSEVAHRAATLLTGDAGE